MGKLKQVSMSCCRSSDLTEAIVKSTITKDSAALWNSYTHRHTYIDTKTGVRVLLSFIQSDASKLKRKDQSTTPMQLLHADTHTHYVFIQMGTKQASVYVLFSSFRPDTYEATNMAKPGSVMELLAASFVHAYNIRIDTTIFLQREPNRCLHPAIVLPTKH